MRKNPILPTLGSTQPQWKLDYIRQNAATQNAAQIKEVIELSDSFIYDYCELHDIPLLKNIHRTKDYRVQKAERKMRVPSLPEKVARFTRPPAKYDNMQPEDYERKYLNVD